MTARLTPEQSNELCAMLHLPRLALDPFPFLGFDPAADAWTVSLEAGAGRAVGLARLFADGRTEASRGLLVPDRWRERDTPVLIVDSFADVLALTLCAISTIGILNARDSIGMPATALADFPDYLNVIVAVRDAEQIASALAGILGRRVAFAEPPDGHETFHGWVLSQKPDPRILDEYHILGETLWD